MAKKYRNLKRESTSEPEISKRYESLANNYYQKKNTLLSHFSPTSIHKIRRVATAIAYDWDANFTELVKNGAETSWFIDKNGKQHFRCIHEDIYYEYFAVYEIGGYTTHKPISADEIDSYNLAVVSIPEILNENDANSQYYVNVNLCDYVLSGLEDGSIHIADEMSTAA